ncbi:MAG: hypothetical protein NXH83_01595 [Rhodobacteraceae bacterium]|nr:hypothetical protein [Paracoccaceae bacterium]
MGRNSYLGGGTVINSGSSWFSPNDQKLDNQHRAWQREGEIALERKKERERKKILEDEEKLKKARERQRKKREAESAEMELKRQRSIEATGEPPRTKSVAQVEERMGKVEVVRESLGGRGRRPFRGG